MRPAWTRKTGLGGVDREVSSSQIEQGSAGHGKDLGQGTGAKE